MMRLMTKPAVTWRRRGYAHLDRIGVRPTGDIAHAALLEAFTGLEASATGRRLVVLDAGCGRKSPLVPFRGRIGRLLGVDIHRPPSVPAYLDDFMTVDLCGTGEGLPAAQFDLVLSNFTIEHFSDPGAAMRNLHRSLRPGGVLVVSTVNRRHPFVAAYLRLPSSLRTRLQPMVKASAADAHPLVGACNTPSELRQALRDAGLVDVRLEMVSNLSHAWGRRPVPFAIGTAGDLLCHTMPTRRSTIVALARRPLSAEG